MVNGVFLSFLRWVMMVRSVCTRVYVCVCLTDFLAVVHSQSVCSSF